MPNHIKVLLYTFLVFIGLCIIILFPILVPVLLVLGFFIAVYQMILEDLDTK